MLRGRARRDRKSTRLNPSHMSISYAVFCLKKKIISRRHLVDLHRAGPGRQLRDPDDEVALRRFEVELDRRLAVDRHRGSGHWMEVDTAAVVARLDLRCEPGRAGLDRDPMRLDAPARIEDEADA